MLYILLYCNNAVGDYRTMTYMHQYPTGALVTTNTDIVMFMNIQASSKYHSHTLKYTHL